MLIILPKRSLSETLPRSSFSFVLAVILLIGPFSFEADAGQGDLVQFPTTEISFIIGPQVKSFSGSSPWPWFDQNQVDRGLTLASEFPADPGILTVTGTVSVSSAEPRKVRGTGTRFLSEFAEGNGVLWIYYSSYGGESGYITYYVSSVESDTELTIDLESPAVTNAKAKRDSKTINSDFYAGYQNYYDFGLAMYNAYYRTGELRFRDYARVATDSWWESAGVLEGELIDDGRGYAPRMVGLAGLMLRAMDGRPEMWPWITRYTRNMFSIWLGTRENYDSLWYGVRDGGFMLRYAADLAAAHPDASVRQEFRDKSLTIAKNYYARLQRPDGGWYWYVDDQHPDVSQPMMIGLMLEGMIAVHELTGDAVVRDSILKAADYLYHYAYDGCVPCRSMFYMTFPEARQLGTVSCDLDQAQNYDFLDQRQLNPHTPLAFGYAYKLTKDPKYRSWGDEIFSSTFGYNQGPGADQWRGLAFYRGKEYNQSYRTSGRYLGYITEAGSSCTYSLAPKGSSLGASGGTGTIDVDTAAGCGWTAESSASWITIMAGGSGSGNGQAGYSVAVNEGATPRSAIMTIGGETFTVTQAGADSVRPSVPTGLQATVISSSQINLSWTAATDNIAVEGYRIYRNGKEIATTAVTTYEDTGLRPKTTYRYQVAAYDASENLSAKSKAVAKTTQPLPSTKFSIGDRVHAAGKIVVRSAASNSGAAVGIQAKGAMGMVIGGPSFANGTWWWQVNFDEDPDGWVIGAKLKE